MNTLFNWSILINHIVIDYNRLLINSRGIINDRFLYLMWLGDGMNDKWLIGRILKDQFLFLIIFRFLHQFCNVGVYVIEIVHGLNLLIIW